MLADDTRPWAQTWSGRAFPLVDPTPDDVYWPDVSYALAHLNRFAGHAGCYSVAQHSILVAENMPDVWQAYGLLHDAHEFVMNDMPTPAARALEYYGREYDTLEGGICVHLAVRQLKHVVDGAIYQAAGLVWPMPYDIAEAIQIADQRALVTEKRDLLAPAPRPWGFEHVEPFKQKVVPWQWPEESFARFNEALRKYGICVGSDVASLAGNQATSRVSDAQS